MSIYKGRLPPRHSSCPNSLRDLPFIPRVLSIARIWLAHFSNPKVVIIKNKTRSFQTAADWLLIVRIIIFPPPNVWRVRAKISWKNPLRWSRSKRASRRSVRLSQRKLSSGSPLHVYNSPKNVIPDKEKTAVLARANALSHFSPLFTPYSHAYHETLFLSSPPLPHRSSPHFIFYVTLLVSFFSSLIFRSELALMSRVPAQLWFCNWEIFSASTTQGGKKFKKSGTRRFFEKFGPIVEVVRHEFLSPVRVLFQSISRLEIA